VRPWLAGERSLERLNALARERGLRTESGRPLHFVPPGPQDPYYEVKVFETGAVSTRPENLHDYFNALAWLAFPRTKARINALHAAEIPREGGQRGRLRDLLTIFDEGGALVRCDDDALLSLLRGFQWKALFWQNRERVTEAMRIVVFGHAVMEQAMQPRPGITCKAMLVPAGGDADAAALGWLERLQPGASPKDLAPLPIFGFPGWHAQGESAEFYDDTRYFRPR
jgi:hypothetical protein